MTDNRIAINDSIIAHWQEMWSSCSDSRQIVGYASGSPVISSRKFSFSAESTENLISIANGSDKRLSLLFIALAACAQSVMSYSSNVTLLTGNYINDEGTTSRKTICLPIQLDQEKTLREVIMNVSVCMQEQMPFSIPEPKDVFSHPVSFPLTVFCRESQNRPSDVNEHSLTQVIFSYDKSNITCEVNSVLGDSFIDAFINIMQKWSHYVRSEHLLNQLPVPEPFIFSGAKAEDTDNDESILSIFCQQVACHPDHIAVTDGFSQLTFRELDIFSTIGAISLCAEGVRKGDSVGIHMPRMCQTIVAIFAILKAGGRYCPFDVEWPSERKNYVQETADICLTITTEDTPLSLNGCRQITYGELTSSVCSQQGEPILPAIYGQDSAYIIFTSGSTGNPKGVEIPHSAVVNLVRGLEQKVYCHYPQILNVSMVSALSFDASVQQMYPALLLGHTLHIVPDDVRKEGRKITQFWSENDIHIADCTPTHIRMIRSQMNGQKINSSVMHLMIGGEKLEQKNWLDFTQCWDVVPNASNAYGPTECCVQSLSYEFQPLCQIKTQVIPIGSPMLGEHIVLLDDSLRILPKGAVGEIAISGKGVAKGYINNEELTQKSFVGIDGNRYYRTGDMARYIGDEGLLFIGRVDSQVKINGYRIELGEIEAVIQRSLMNRCDNNDSEVIVDVCVVVNKNDADNLILVSYICANITFNTDHLRHDVASLLPYYMVPAYFIPVDDFPQNSSGKIDYARLPDPHCDIVERNIIDCETEIEYKIRKLWAEVLMAREENISLNDNFFDLGGSSFKLAQLSIRLSEMFSREVEVVDLFQYTTVQSQACYIEENNTLSTFHTTDIEDSTEQFNDALKMFGL